MEKPYKNICYRCGKERTISKVWKEKIGNSTVEITETVCPDKKCQKIIKQEIRKQINKRLQMEKRKKESIKNRRKAAHHKTVSKHK